MPYILKTERVALRTWEDSDLEAFAEMNADPEVMRYFKTALNKAESKQLLQRLKEHYQTHGYTYFAAETVKAQEFIGFVGLAYQTYENPPYTPYVDIGWRLKRASWGKGYATEAAFACLKFGFEPLELETIYSVTPLQNLASERVMQKIGMTKIDEFEHPKIPDGNPLKTCVLYRKQKKR